MTNSIEIELAGSTKKFISVGNQTFLNSKGQTETCRKGLKGQHCQRHHGGSITSFAEAREKLDAFAERTAEKLSPFENGCVWLYSLLMRIPLEEARQRYINATAMYSLIGIRKPSESEVKGLQKILLKLADVSQVTSTRMDNLKRLIKKMTVGNGFSEAGFYSLKDMVKDSTMKLKLGLTGVGVAGVFTLTGCSGNPISDTVSKVTYDGFKVQNQSGSDKMILAEKVKDQYGEYTRTYVEGSNVKLDDGSTPSGDKAAAINAAVKFTTLEALDSIALDDNSRWEEWKTNVAPQYISSKYIGSIFNKTDPTASDIVLHNDNNILPVLLRDGGARIADKRVSHITATPNANGGYDVSMSGTALVYFNDKSGTPWYSSMAYNTTNAGQMYNSDGTVMTKEQQDAYLKSMGAATNPIYSDGKDNSMLLNYSTSYSMIKEGDSWKIAGYGNTFELKTGIVESGSGQMDYRNNITK